jgi:hypothetical protein
MGFVYIISNPSMPGLIKVGFTKNQLSQRLTELWSSGVSEPFILEAFVETDEPNKLEKQSHKVLSEYRYNDKREFFKISVNEALEILTKEITNIEWKTDCSYEIVKNKTDWVDTYTKKLKTLIDSIEEFEKKAIIDFEKDTFSDDWFPKKKLSSAGNKDYFDKEIKYPVELLIRCLHINRPNVLGTNFYKLKEDDAQLRKEVNQAIKKFEQFKKIVQTP